MIIRTMPDGTPKSYPDGTPESVIQADIDRIQAEINKRDKGLLADVSEPLKKNWLYDTIAVAPYEGVRKGLNSILDLTEGIGDTLGEKSNVGGFRYGKDAKNGLVEYVGYDQAIQDLQEGKKTYGVLSPFTGAIGVSDAYNIKGFFYDPANPDNDNHTQTMAGNLVEGVAQFLFGFKGVDKGFKIAKVGKATTKAGQFGQITTKGAITDFTIFDGQSGRLTDLLDNYAPDTVDTYLSYLKSDPTDTFWEGRFKNALEGAGIGASADILFRISRVIKNGLSANPNKAQVEKDLQVIDKHTETMETVNQKIDENTTISEKMKLMNDMVEEVDGVKKFKTVNTLTDAKKTQLIIDASNQGLKKNFEKWQKGELSSEEAFNIPEAFINLKSYKKGLTYDGLKTFKTMYDTVHKLNKKLDKRITDEAVKRKAVTEFGGDVNRVFQEFSKFADNIDDTNSLIFAHEVAYTSLLNAFPRIARAYKSGSKGYTRKDMDLMYFMLENMGNNSKRVKSATGRNLRIYQLSKQEFENAKLIEDQILEAQNGYKNFGGGEKGFERFLDQVAIADNPHAIRKIVNLTWRNKTWNVLNEYWINALLSSPKTQLVNATSNGVLMGARPIEEMVGAKLSQLISAGDQAKVREFKLQYDDHLATLTGLGQYVSDANKYFMSAFRSGEQVLQRGDIDAGKLDSGSQKSIRSDRKDAVGKVINTTGETVRLPSRFLNAGDEWFKQINYRAKLRAIGIREGKRQGLKGKELQKFADEHFRMGFDETGTRGINEEALEYATENTFQNELVGVSARFQQLISDNPFLKQFFPFVKTPFNIAKQILDRTPIGAVYNYKHVLGMSGDPRLIAKARGQLAVGSIVLSSAYMLATNGYISNRTNYAGDGRSLDVKKDAELIRQKKTDTNFRPYSIKFSNGYQLSFGQLDPFGAMLGIMADYVMLYDKMTEEEKEKMGLDLHTGLLNSSELSVGQKFSNFLGASKGALQRNTMSKTYLKALSDIIEAINSEDSYNLERYISQKAGSFIPNIYTKLVNDPYIRDAIGILEGVKNRSGFFQPSSPRYNAIGEPHMDKDNFAQRLFKNGLDVFGTTKKRKDILTDELLRLGKGLPVQKPIINNIDFKKFKNNKGVSAWDRYNQLLSTTRDNSGRTMREAMEELIQTDYYKTLADPKKMGSGLVTGMDSTSKYAQLRVIQENFKLLVEIKMQSEMKNFFSEEDKRMDLFTANNNMNENKITIKQPRLDKQQIKLKPIMSFGTQ